MRIIKFRGKSLNTKMWVYGDLNHRGKRTFIEYEVDCKTIGQFIGKTDKEGTEIYEHDIISVNGKYPKLVKYIDEYACFCLANISDLNKEWMNPWQQISPDWWNDFKREIRVIGNAFDNPELMKARKHYFTHELKYDNGVEKTLTLPAMKFLSVRTWDKVRDYIRFHDDLGHLWDERMRRCDTERVGRVVNHFQNDDNAYFMVINAPNTEVHLITGEIGICSLLTGQRGHFELPRVSYQTSKGNVVLFPDEIMPVDINLLQQEINEGYIMLSDGRYLPPKEAVQQCYNAFGIRVGLGDNWEDIYDGWNKEMK